MPRRPLRAPNHRGCSARSRTVVLADRAKGVPPSSGTMWHEPVAPWAKHCAKLRTLRCHVKRSVACAWHLRVHLCRATFVPQRNRFRWIGADVLILLQAV